MTREDAIQYLTDTGISSEHIMELVEALNSSEEPCTDAISREAVIDIIEDVCPIYGNDYRYILRDKVNELPPVNPAEKQEPCTDAISRAEVLSHAKTERGNGHEQPFDYVEVDVIKQLPPVTPSYNSIKTELDCVSRQAVMDCFKKWQPYMATRLWDFEKELSALPPVTPAEKVGKWIKSRDSYGNNHFTCPFCDNDIATKYDGAWEDNYCSNCGAKMKEVENESND